MKYVYWILLSILVAAALLLTRRAEPPPQPEDIALVINGQAITTAELERRRAAAPPTADAEEFLDTVITRQLIVQEAQRLGLDQEEPFRISLQNFYEQSLVKALTDRVFAEAPDQAAASDLAAYRAKLGHTLHLTVGPAPGSDDPGAPPRELVETFEALSGPLRLAVAGLTAEGESRSLRVGDTRRSLRLDQIEPPPATAAPALDEDTLRRLIIDDRRRQSVADWLWDLRQRASISFENVAAAAEEN